MTPETQVRVVVRLYQEVRVGVVVRVVAGRTLHINAVLKKFVRILGRVSCLGVEIIVFV